MIDEIRNRIFPVYKKLLDENSFKDVCVFSFQWGENYPFHKKSGILFVGKAVNGWVTNETNITELFEKSNPDRIFARKDQMVWVSNFSGNTNGYNTRKSAFWRLVKKVSETYYPEKWYSNIAWTNLYKIAPWQGGNPGKKLQDIQKKYCFELLKREIEILSPKYVIFLTSGWEKPFVQYLNGHQKTRPIKEKKWGKYKTALVEISDINFVLSHHPQGKSEWEHHNAIIQLIGGNRDFI